MCPATTVVAMFFALASPAFLAAQSSTLATVNTTGTAGFVVAVPISFTSGTGTTAGLQWSYSLPTGASIVSTQAGPAAVTAQKQIYCRTDGTLCLLAGLNQTLIANGVVAILWIRIDSTATGSLALTLSAPIEAALDGTGQTITVTAGSLTIQQPITFTGSSISGSVP